MLLSPFHNQRILDFWCQLISFRMTISWNSSLALAFSFLNGSESGPTDSFSSKSLIFWSSSFCCHTLPEFSLFPVLRQSLRCFSFCQGSHPVFRKRIFPHQDLTDGLNSLCLIHMFSNLNGVGLSFGLSVSSSTGQ